MEGEEAGFECFIPKGQLFLHDTASASQKSPEITWNANTKEPIELAAHSRERGAEISN